MRSKLIANSSPLAFRGALFGWVRKRLSAMPTILVTSMLFAVIHMEALLLTVTFLWGIAAG